MNADRQFKMRVSEEDLKHIRFVAKRMQRSQADAVKVVFRELFKVMKEDDGGKKLIAPDPP